MTVYSRSSFRDLLIQSYILKCMPCFLGGSFSKNSKNIYYRDPNGNCVVSNGNQNCFSLFYLIGNSFALNTISANI